VRIAEDATVYALVYVRVTRTASGPVIAKATSVARYNQEENMDAKCPSEDPNARAIPQDYVCPACGASVEIWTDEKQAKCPKCSVVVKSAEAQLAG
jgi:DNA-directed RNA polymerase subunit RPC12/RpoP